jgi:hypothetical protein
MFSSNRGKPQNQMAQTSLLWGHMTKTSIKISNEIVLALYEVTDVQNEKTSIEKMKKKQINKHQITRIEIIDTETC